MGKNWAGLPLMPPGKAQLKRNPPTIGTNPSNQMVIWAHEA
ncbi:uncharacterized protein METZ01_LOCUS201133 [marine metagenome]|uniref:Uncharacterized protein n=1 Tax=marine metagenome TaxID=408172 RepID=A0A382ECZ5_9ZZZZ